MLIRRLSESREFTAGDHCLLRELLHPDKADIQCRYSLAHAVVRPAQTTLPHRLKGASEVYYILAGQGIMHINGEKAPVEAGCAVYIPPEAEQCIQNNGTEDLVFICLVDPAWQQEFEEVLKDK